MSSSQERRFGLPSQPANERKKECGICESRKVELLGDEGILLCRHCDLESCKAPCGICRSGMKGLPETDER